MTSGSLWDARDALDAVGEFIAGDLETFVEDRLVRSAVERLFEIA